MNVAIIVAAGQGTRMGGERAKQFLELAGVHVIVHTLRRVEQCTTIAACIVVLPAIETSSFLTVTKQFKLRKLTRIVAGGATRTESVARGLQTVQAATAGIIAVLAGVRPFVTPAQGPTRRGDGEGIVG